MTESFRAAKGPPPSLDGFRAELGRQGFDHAAGVYAAMQKTKPDFKLDEAAVNSWAGELMADSHFQEAIDLRKLNIEIHPESSSAFDNLADAYQQSGQKHLAIESYKKLLEKFPANENAVRKLKELEDTTGN